MDDYPRQASLGDTVINLGDILVDNMDSRGFSMETIGGDAPFGTMIASGPVADFAAPPKVVPDPGRRALTRREWMGEFFKTSSQPVGHGCNQANLNTEFACYSLEPKSAAVPTGR